MDMKSLIIRPSRSGFGRGICAALGILVAAALYYLGYTPAEPTMLSGIAYAAVGAAGGILVYGIYDVIRTLL
ncbi:MAG: hypothetical protein GKS00_11640 [Alphaproteobacteria bacterium]|nr:hypothetical protein [Alphaproteobacteria bacterium]